MAITKKPGPKTRPIVFKTSFEGTPDQAIQVELYAFDRSGRFLDQTAVEENIARLRMDQDQAARTRLFFGPPLPESMQQEKPTLKTMGRLHAYEAVWRFDPDARVYEIAPYPEHLWRCWLWCSCRVRGQVVRPLEVGGELQELPTCHTRVHICEVDPFPRLIYRLPDYRILRLRDELIKELERPLRWPRPLPDPPPFKYDPGVIDPSPENIARMTQPAASRTTLEPDLDRDKMNPQPEPPAKLLAELPVAAKHLSVTGEMAALGPQPEPPDRELTALPVLSMDIQRRLASDSVSLLRRTLADYYQVLILPYLCYWPWFWPWLSCDELAVLETDPQGRFDTTIWYLCGGDKPDLYFWVEAFIGGSWTVVYKPPLPCNVDWNYVCGSEVTIRVTDPRVPVCEEPPDLDGLQVAVMSIGNNVSISEIQASGAGQGLTTSGGPFGGRLEPHVWFSRAALISAGITHYRWSYQRLTKADGSAVSDSWHAMDRRVIRHYAMIENTPPDYPLSFPAYNLGPDPAFGSKNLFQIQPINVPVTPPAGSTITGWAAWLDAREDLASAFFMSHQLAGGDAALAAGNYQLKFELFDSSGNLVNLSDSGILLKEADQAAPFGSGTVTTKPAPDHHRIKDGSGKTIGFKLVLRIDNNPCEAQIYTVSGPGLTVDANCGFVRYAPGAGANIRFQARHRNDFAWFRFEIHRGPSIKVPEASAPAAGITTVGHTPADAVNGFVPNASHVYAKPVPVVTLLTSNKPPSSPDCTSAAFAETLYVWAKATDGWHRLHHLDARGTPKAFALAPAP